MIAVARQSLVGIVNYKTGYLLTILPEGVEGLHFCLVCTLPNDAVCTQAVDPPFISPYLLESTDTVRVNMTSGCASVT